MTPDSDAAAANTSLENQNSNPSGTSPPDGDSAGNPDAGANSAGGDEAPPAETNSTFSLNTVNNGPGDGGDGETLGGVEQNEDDPAGHGVFAPTSSILILERDGVTVRGSIDARTGDGAKELAERLKANLILLRAGQPLPPEPPLAEIASADRAAEAGHEPDPETGRCVHCGVARWAQLEGQPCEPRAQDGEPVAEALADAEAYLPT